MNRLMAHPQEKGPKGRVDYLHPSATTGHTGTMCGVILDGNFRGSTAGSTFKATKRSTEVAKITPLSIMKPLVF